MTINHCLVLWPLQMHGHPRRVSKQRTGFSDRRSAGCLWPPGFPVWGIKRAQQDKNLNYGLRQSYHSGIVFPGEELNLPGIKTVLWGPWVLGVESYGGQQELAFRSCASGGRSRIFQLRAFRGFEDSQALKTLDLRSWIFCGSWPKIESGSIICSSLTDQNGLMVVPAFRMKRVAYRFRHQRTQAPIVHLNFLPKCVLLKSRDLFHHITLSSRYAWLMLRQSSVAADTTISHTTCTLVEIWLPRWFV